MKRPDAESNQPAPMMGALRGVTRAPVRVTCTVIRAAGWRRASALRTDVADRSQFRKALDEASGPEAPVAGILV